MVKLNILHVKASHGFLTKAMSIYFEINPSKFLPMTGSKIKIDECTLLGSSRTHVGATTNLSKTSYNVYCTLC